MDRNEKKGQLPTKTEKQKLLQSAKAEDVEFAALKADMDDLEALSRGEGADRRQLKEILKDNNR